MDWSYYWTGLNIKLLQNGGLNTVFWDIFATLAQMAIVLFWPV